MKVNKYVRAEILKLRHKHSTREIAEILDIGKSTVARAIKRFKDRQYNKGKTLRGFEKS